MKNTGNYDAFDTDEAVIESNFFSSYFRICKSYGRIRVRIGIVLMLIRIRIWIGTQHGNSDPDRHKNDVDLQYWFCRPEDHPHYALPRDWWERYNIVNWQSCDKKYFFLLIFAFVKLCVGSAWGIGIVSMLLRIRIEIKTMPIHNTAFLGQRIITTTRSHGTGLIQDTLNLLEPTEETLHREKTPFYQYCGSWANLSNNFISPMLFPREKY